jgi:hypothetical protein
VLVRVRTARRHGLRPLAGLLLLGLAGCQPPAGPTGTASDISFHWSVSPSPPATGPARFSAALAEPATGRPVRGAAIKLEGDMSHPGMQPVFGTAREVAPGVYEAAIDFTMAGDWVLLVDATLRDGRTLQRQVLLPGVRAR